MLQQAANNYFIFVCGWVHQYLLQGDSIIGTQIKSSWVHQYLPGFWQHYWSQIKQLGVPMLAKWTDSINGIQMIGALTQIVVACHGGCGPVLAIKATISTAISKVGAWWMMTFRGCTDICHGGSNIIDELVGSYYWKIPGG